MSETALISFLPIRFVFPDYTNYLQKSKDIKSIFEKNPRMTTFLFRKNVICYKNSQ